MTDFEKTTKKPVIVMPRSEPDLDGVACAYAYAELLQAQGRAAIAWYVGEPDGEAMFALERLGWPDFAADALAASAEEFILVDSSDLDGIPSSIDPSLFSEVIDHRFYTSASTQFPAARVEIEPVGAAATLIAERFVKAGYTPTRRSATLLYGAIHSNTLDLKGDLTTDRDVDASRWLRDTGLPPSNWLDEQFAHRRDEILGNFRAMIQREQKEYRNKEIGAFRIAQLEFIGAEKAIATERTIIEQTIAIVEPTTCLNLVDITSSTSFFITSSPAIQSKLENMLGAQFISNVAQFSPALLRKQMVLAINGPG